MAKEVQQPIMTAKVVCTCCHRLKTCGRYILQDCSTAWVCIQCREGR